MNIPVPFTTEFSRDIQSSRFSTHSLGRFLTNFRPKLLVALPELSVSRDIKWHILEDL